MKKTYIIPAITVSCIDPLVLIAQSPLGYCTDKEATTAGGMEVKNNTHAISYSVWEDDWQQ